MFARKHLASPRKIKAALVKRPVAFVIVEVNFHVISVRTKNNFANCLHLLASVLYVYPALHKTSAGIRTPCKLLATSDAASVFFVVCHMRHSMAWCRLSEDYNPCGLRGCINEHHAAHNGAVCTSFDGVRSRSLSLLHRTPRRQRMVTLAGQSQGWPVSSNAGSSNPVNVTALYEIRTSSGDSVNLLLEAA
ncbi:ash family protein [Salmonella enterica]|nr:ash family protein [Salmonella enterica]